MSVIATNLQAVLRRIDAAARAAGRDPASIRLVAASKTFPASDVALALACGQRDFGENYVQEGVDKIAQLRALTVTGGHHTPQWHFIGPIQSNKTRLIAENFDWVHSVDRLKIAERLSAQRPPDCAPLRICIEVNISGEASKSGAHPAEVETLARQIMALPRLSLCGLMAIPEPAASEAAQRQPFAAVRELAQTLQARQLPLTELSMGMSADLEAAIAEGATMVRIGTAIFGQRHYAQ